MSSSPGLHPSYSSQEVASHNKSDDLWVVIDGKIFDLTNYMHEHPGGKKGSLILPKKNRSDQFQEAPGSSSLEANESILSAVLLSMGGADATKKYHKYHRPSTMARFGEALCVGVIKKDEKMKEKKTLKKLISSIFHKLDVDP